MVRKVGIGIEADRIDRVPELDLRFSCRARVRSDVRSDVMQRPRHARGQRISVSVSVSSGSSRSGRGDYAAEHQDSRC